MRGDTPGALIGPSLVPPDGRIARVVGVLTRLGQSLVFVFLFHCLISCFSPFFPLGFFLGGLASVCGGIFACFLLVFGDRGLIGDPRRPSANPGIGDALALAR